MKWGLLLARKTLVLLLSNSAANAQGLCYEEREANGLNAALQILHGGDGSRQGQIAEDGYSNSHIQPRKAMLYCKKL
jgi:hypothetical protein